MLYRKRSPCRESLWWIGWPHFKKMSKIFLSRKICHYFVHKNALSRVSEFSYTVFLFQIHFKMDSNPINIDINCLNSSEILPFEPSSRVNPLLKNVSNVTVQKICHYFVHKNAFSRVLEFSYTVFLF